MSTAAIAALALTLLAQPCAAETVRVQVSPDRSGEGWLFSSHDTCQVVTAGHVVAGSPRPLLIAKSGEQAAGRVIATPPAQPKIGGAAMDAVALELTGRLASGCSDDLGFESLSPLLQRLLRSGSNLYIEKVGPHGSSEVVELLLTAVNKDGARLTVRLAHPQADAIVESDSGSPVLLRSADALNSGLPIGLVTNDLGDGEVSVLRMDTIRAWITSVRAAPAANPVEAGYRILGWSANTPDPGCGPSNLLDPAAACGWRATPPIGKTRVSLDIEPLDHSLTFASVAVDLGPGSSATGVAVEAQDPAMNGADSWFALPYCPAQSNQLAVRCGFAPTKGPVFRVIVSGLAGEIRAIRLNPTVSANVRLPGTATAP